MQANGFLKQKQHHPIGMGVIVAGHVAVIAALMLAKAPIIENLPEAIRIIPITDQAPPPPVDTPPLPERPQTQREQPTVPTPEVPTRSDSEGYYPPLPPQPPIGPAGTGTGVTTTPQPMPMPVLTDALLDTRYADQFQPPYPPGKQRLGEEGKAVLRVLIGADGRVKKVERVSGDDAFLSVSERQALRRWRFKPATRDGVPVEAWKTMTVRFEID